MRMPVVSAFGLLLALGIQTHAASAQSVGGFPSPTPPSPPATSAPAGAPAPSAAPVPVAPATASPAAPGPAPADTAAPASTPGTEPPPPPAAAPLAPATVVTAPAQVEPLPAPIPAPDPTVHHHDGFYLSMGLGAGYAWSDVSKAPVFGDLSAKGAGVALELALGGTVADGLVIGGGLYTTSVSRLRWKRTISDGDASQQGDQGSVALLGVFIDYYPNPKDGLHVQGALGIGTLNYERDSSTGVPPETWAGGGGGAMLGVGYEAWVASQWSLGGVLRVIGVSTAMRGEDSDVNFDGRAISTALLFSATYH
jgi:hypothetical protein